MKPKFIDNKLFMGMHSDDESVRIYCKNFFVENLKNPLIMSREQVGECDKVMWNRHSRKEQLLYYPFQDHMHTVLNLARMPYSEKDVRKALGMKNGLNTTDKLTLAMALVKNCKLSTINDSLVRLNNPNVIKPVSEKELKFPNNIEKLYQTSLKVRIKDTSPISNNVVKECIDASLFSGMNSRNDKVRKSCKNFFVENIRGSFGITLEQVGEANEVIWQRSGKEQEKYWPFMDTLHTVMKMEKINYSEQDLKAALNIKNSKLSITEKLTLGVIESRKLKLNTINGKFGKLNNAEMVEVLDDNELKFPKDIEKLYVDSLVIRI